ncbi:ABC transporter substrate-binding protein [Nocardiopsis sp. NPDC006139]|uniref:ABC transporter substrate-binding protein n=1 Tax=Nocardiopsis sp. NPDC006139 TaxID=3154578 RepID=UPI0033ABC9B6
MQMTFSSKKSFRSGRAVTAATLAFALTACSGGATIDDEVEGAVEPVSGSLVAGYVAGIDQLGLPIGTELGLFEGQGLDVTLADPFPTGVEAINALEAGDVDIIQVGVPGVVAVHNDIDLVFVGNYSGSSVQRSVDDTLSVIATEGSGIDPDDLSTLKGATVATSVGTINHLYLLGMLRDLRIDTDEVDLVNTAPPDMPIALETGGADAIASWDPWPIITTDQVEGSYDVVRGGGYIPYVGYIVTTPRYLENNRELIEAFLTARAASDQWIRRHPDEAAEAVTRWLTGTDLQVAQAAMEHNVTQLDPRFSACNYLALDTVAILLEEQEVVEYDFDINELVDPSLILSVQENNPELFSDLPAIPEPALIDTDHKFLREVDQQACTV